MVQIKDTEGLYRFADNPGVWPQRGQVAIAGIGHSPTLRRWDGKAESTIGAWTILAIRKAIEDAGIDPGEIEALVITRATSTGAHWPEDQEIPQEFKDKYETTDDWMDGLAQLSPEWLLKNIPELKNVKLALVAPADMSYILTAAIQVVAEGQAKAALAVKGWNNFEGRYYHGGENAEPLVRSASKWVNSLAGPMSFWWAQQFQRYMWKYGKTHEMLAPFVVNSKKNGLLFPEGYWAQNRPDEVTIEDYNNARWICKPANIYDNDIPIHTAGAYVVTTAERAKDLKQKPVYILGHAGAGSVAGEEGISFPHVGGVQETLEEAQLVGRQTAGRLYESAGVTAADLDFENVYDGFSLFHVFMIESFGYAGLKEGEALDFFESEDITIHGPHPVSPSGGNIGSGRTRFWLYTDTIQQIQGRAGARQISKPANIGLAGGMTGTFGSFMIMSSTPDF